MQKINFTEVSDLSQISHRTAKLIGNNIHDIEKNGKFSGEYNKDESITIHISARKKNKMIEVTKQFTSKGGIPLPDQHYRCHVDNIRGGDHLSH